MKEQLLFGRGLQLGTNTCSKFPKKTKVHQCRKHKVMLALSSVYVQQGMVILSLIRVHEVHGNEANVKHPGKRTIFLTHGGLQPNPILS